MTRKRFEEQELVGGQHAWQRARGRKIGILNK
jgi:hypothetical protein